MSDFLSSLTLSASGMSSQSARLKHVSENIANADTPGYRRKLVTFDSAMDDVGTVTTGRVFLDRRDLEKVYDPAHPMADKAGYYDGSNVDLIVEIADAREAQRSYEANLKMFEQARNMSSGLFDLLRK